MTSQEFIDQIRDSLLGTLVDHFPQFNNKELNIILRHRSGWPLLSNYEVNLEEIQLVIEYR